MSRCEMCGASADTLTTVKIEQAELDVCDSCAEMGTTVEEEPTVKDSETKYSTDSSEPNANSNENESSTTSQSHPSSGTPAMGTSELRTDFGDALREAREEAGLSLTALADELNEKESHLRQIEHENRQPTEELQDDLEEFFDFELSSESDFTDFEDGPSSEGQTLGDVADFDV